MKRNVRRKFQSVISVILIITLALSMAPMNTRAAETNSKQTITISTQAELMKALSEENVLTIII
jgi:hypothetical protein